MFREIVDKFWVGFWLGVAVGCFWIGILVKDEKDQALHFFKKYQCETGKYFYE